MPRPWPLASARSSTRPCKFRNPRRQIRHRRLVAEPLEDRRVLSGVSPQIELFGVSPALFVENQSQWADSSVRFLHQGNGANEQ